MADRTPDEIKKGLEVCTGFGGCAACPYHEEGMHGCVGLEEDALTYIRQLEAQVPQWISVKDQPPEKGAKVIFVATSTRQVVMGIYVGVGKSGGHWFRSYKASQTGTHWMPRPEPPEEV